MTTYSKQLILLCIAFLSATVITYLVDSYLFHGINDKSIVPHILCPMLCYLVLFALSLLLVIKQSKDSKDTIQKLQKELSQITDDLNDAQSSLDAAVEKKTFEMSVINGSLNREIAERIQAEYEGEKLRRQMHAILDSAGEGIFGINSEGMVTFVNHKATELLGWQKEELIGKSHHTLVHHTRKTGERFPLEECPIYLAYKDGQMHSESDDIFWTKDGRSFPVEYTSTPLFDGDEENGAVVLFKDISKSKQLQKQRDLILDSAGEGILGLDDKGNVTFINKAASIMLGWEQEELIGKSHHNLVHHSHANGDRYLEKDCPIFMACTDGEVHFKSDDVFWTKEGESINVEYSSTPIFEGRKITGAVVMFRDLNTFS